MFLGRTVSKSVGDIADGSANSTESLMEQTKLTGTNMADVSDKIYHSHEKISDIAVFNEKIVEAITSISSVSEQTMAASEETAAISQEHIRQLQNVKELVNGLIGTSNELKKYFQ